MAVDAIKGATHYETQKSTTKQESITSMELQKKSQETDAKMINNTTQDTESLPVIRNDQQLLKSAVNQANYKFKQNRTSCEFTYHEQTKQVSIKIIDADTKEVIREIPSEDSIKMVEKMWELAGILVDERR